MDGNGRWAKARNLPRIAGHQQGAHAARECIIAAIDQQVRYLTLFGFSAENWKRPASEIKDLMSLLAFYLNSERQLLLEKNVRFRVIGEREKLEPDLNNQINLLEEETKNNTSLDLILAISYGSRQEIIRAAQKLIEYNKITSLYKDNLFTEKDFTRFLWTSDIPDPDLIIRTSGEQRLSNFLLWQSAYAELLFLDVLWPDFTRKDFAASIDVFQKRQRRYGMVDYE